jgi:hypothetical protein
MKPALTIETLAEAWAQALPSKESVERDSVSALDRFADLRRTSPEVREVPIAAVSNRSKKNYSITSSAATSSPGGTVRPSARSETGRQISC